MVSCHHNSSRVSLIADVPLQPLLFQDEPRLARLPATPLPPPSMIVDFENNLMSHLLTAPDLDRLETIDRPRLLNLYNRYRALPTSLTDDQKALVYAALCIARHSQMRDGPATAMFDPATPSREDVTYYHMSKDAVQAWNRPSVDALCKLPEVSGADIRGTFLSIFICDSTRWYAGYERYPWSNGMASQGTRVTSNSNFQTVPAAGYGPASHRRFRIYRYVSVFKYTVLKSVSEQA